MVSCIPVVPGPLTALLDGASAALVALDRDWCVLYATRQAGRVLGTSVESLLGAEFWEIRRDLAGSAAGAQCRALAAAGRPGTVTFHEGDRGPTLEIHVDPADDGVLLTLRERTGVPETGLGRVERDGRLSWANERLAELTGFNQHDVPCRALADVLAGDGVPEAVRGVLAGDQESANVSAYCPRGAGEGVRLQVALSLVRSPGGSPDYALLVAHPAIGGPTRTPVLQENEWPGGDGPRSWLPALELLTEPSVARLPLDASLEELLDRVRQALSAETATVLLLAEDGDEPRVRAIAGQPDGTGPQAGVALGQEVAGAIAASGQPLTVNDLAALHGGQPLGDVTPRSLAGVPLLVEGAVIGVLLVGSTTSGRFGRDDVALLERVAERVALAVAYTERQREAREALAARNAFFSSVSHDLRNPLTSIKGLAQISRRQLVREKHRADDRLLRNLGFIGEAADRMAVMLGELLDAARLEHGSGLELDRAPVDLVELVCDSVTAHQSTAPEHRLSLATHEAELIGVWDAARLERVLANLLSNAVKYSPGGGAIQVTVACEEAGGQDWAVLRVQDHGIGIPAADLPRIAEQFFRASNVTGRIAGTGIGLAGSRAVVEEHDGTLTVESTEGAGTTVTVRLPLA